MMAAFPDVGFQNMTLRLKSATAISMSPFTFDQQIVQHQGVRWEAEVTLAPLKRADAKAIEAFFAALRGQGGTFTMGCPLHSSTASGTCTGSVGSTSVTMSAGAVGDYFSISDRLYIKTGSGTIMPPLRTTGGTCNFSAPKGTWRLATNDIDWNMDRAGIYGFTFACVEAL
jgi:hypothetical protein